MTTEPTPRDFRKVSLSCIGFASLFAWVVWHDATEHHWLHMAGATLGVLLHGGGALLCFHEAKKMACGREGRGVNDDSPLPFGC